MKTADQNPAAASRESRRYWAGWLGIIAVVSVAVGSVFAIAILREQVGNCNRVQTLLLSLDRTAHEMNSLEWQAIAKKKLDAELSEKLEQTRAELTTLIGNLASHGLDQQSLKGVTTCYSVYQQAVDVEFELIAAGRIDEAETLDEKRVDPAFNALRESVSAADAVYDAAARRKVQAANVGSTLIVLFASGVIGLLFWRFTRARLASQLAKAEQGLLRETNEALQAEVAERRRAETTLARVSRQNQLLLSSVGEGIFGLDLEGWTTFANPAAARLLGHSAEEMIGRPQHALIHHTRPDGAPYPRENCLIHAAFRDGLVHHMDTEVFWRKDGTSFPVDYTSTPIRDEQGALEGAVVVFRDITERKQTEDKLRQLSRAVEQSPASIMITNPAGDIEYVNLKFTAVTGYTLAEALGKNPRVLKSGDKSPESYRELWQTITAGEEWRGEFHNKKKSGELYWEFASISPIRDSAGRTTHYLAVKEDITERKKADAQREFLIKSLEEALANVKSLSGLIPICASCKQIRDDKGYWNQVETYVAEHSQAKFSHGICPECAKKLYPDFVG